MSRLFRRSWCSLVVAGLFACLTVARVQAESPLSFIPQDAAVVARFKSPAAAIDVAVKWYPEKMQGPAREMLTDWIKAGGDDPRTTQEWWLVCFFKPNGDPVYVSVLQTTDLEGAKKAHAAAAEHTVIADWHVFADSTATTARLKECRAGKIKSLAATMKRPAKELFEKGGMAVYFDAGKLRAANRQTLDALKTSLSESLQRAYQPRPADQNPKGGPPNPPNQKPQPAQDMGWAISDPKTFEAITNCWHGVVHLVEETETVTISLTIDEKGLELQSYVAVAPGSPTDRFFVRHPPSEMKALGHLPVGRLAYCGFSGEVTELVRSLTQWNVSSLDQPAVPRQAISQSLQSMSLEKVVGCYGAIAFGDELAGPLTWASVIECGSAPQAREFETRAIEQTSGQQLRRHAETIAGEQVDLAIGKVPEGAEPDTNDAGRAILKACYATTTSLETRIASLPGVVLQCVGGRKEMLQLLHNFQSDGGTGAQASWKTTREHCGTKANFIALFDLSRCVFALVKVVAIPVSGAAGNEDKAAREQTKRWESAALALLRTLEPSYCGIAVAFEPHAVRCRIGVPREQVSGFMQFYELTMDTLMAAPAGPAPAKPAAPADLER
jgi:hypothetical protein